MQTRNLAVIRAILLRTIILMVASFLAHPAYSQRVENGSEHTCSLSRIGHLYCWGSNQYGQIGGGSEGGAQIVPLRIDVGSEIREVAVGGEHTCALDVQGGVFCWGRDDQGQLGDGIFGPNRGTPAYVDGLSEGVKSVAAGYEHTCAMLTSGDVYCWGYFDSGALGSIYRATPYLVANVGADALRISAGGHHTCVLRADASVSCWGNNSAGQLGFVGPASGAPGATVSGLPGGALDIDVGYRHTCALVVGGLVYCWGDDQRGQLGDGSSGGSRSSPAAVNGLVNAAVQLAAGYLHTCMTDIVGDAFCWGYDDEGQLGDGQVGPDRSVPERILLDDSISVRSVSAGGYHSCALLGDDTVMCWGKDDKAQLGDGDRWHVRRSPIEVVGLPNGVSDIALGSRHACALTPATTVMCWGANELGQLGSGIEFAATATPVVASLSPGNSDVSAGGSHSCVVDSNDAVRCWGYDYAGQLGDGTIGVPDVNNTPSGAVAGISAPSEVTLGAAHSCARSIAGGVRCWGRDDFGQLGDGIVGPNRPTASNVVSMTINVTSLATGGGHSCGILQGVVRCWGSDQFGQLGDGSAGIGRATPADVSGLGATALQVATGDSHTCALIAGGGVWCWGTSRSGQIGVWAGDFPAPTQIPSLSSGVEVIAAGGESTCALRDDGSVWCWGSLAYSNEQYPAPRAIPGLTDVQQIVVAGDNACAREGSGKVKCWGADNFGQLGDGSIDGPTPVRVVNDPAMPPVEVFSSGFE